MEMMRSKKASSRVTALMESIDHADTETCGSHAPSPSRDPAGIDMYSL